MRTAATAAMSAKSNLLPPLLSEAVIAQTGRLLVEAAALPAQVFLFGSQVCGEAGEDSDLDFLVVESGDQPPTAQEIMRSAPAAAAGSIGEKAN